MLDLLDSAANVRTFGRPKGSRANAAFPQVRLQALCELGTHIVYGLAGVILRSQGRLIGEAIGER